MGGDYLFPLLKYDTVFMCLFLFAVFGLLGVMFFLISGFFVNFNILLSMKLLFYMYISSFLLCFVFIITYQYHVNNIEGYVLDYVKFYLMQIEKEAHESIICDEFVANKLIDKNYEIKILIPCYEVNINILKIFNHYMFYYQFKGNELLKLKNKIIPLIKHSCEKIKAEEKIKSIEYRHEFKQTHMVIEYKI